MFSRIFFFIYAIVLASHRWISRAQPISCRLTSFCNKMPEPDRDVLPTNVTPVHYDLVLTPNLESFTFDGIVDIEVKVNQDTKVVECNASELTIQSAELVAKSSNTPAAKIEWNAKSETVAFHFDSVIAAGQNVKLHVVFSGILNDRMAGFYRSAYTGRDGTKKFMGSTQFEATDARKAFPCFDEPALKATFSITLNVEEGLVALSNSPVESEKKVELNLGGKKVPGRQVTFEKTPIMSTYLVAWVVGEMDYIEAQAVPKSPKDAKPITVRVYTAPGKKEQGHFALNVAKKTLEYFSEYFDIAHPLTKSDQAAIGEFSAGAMENWGLITYREIYLLVDEKKSSAKAKERVAYVVGHELAHQWFGNLVTMDWWQDLWLNEGFATFVGWLAVDCLFPSWNVWTQFINDDFSRGLVLDAMRSSHPIEVPVKNPAEISQIFDAISYSKGASVIRMLANSISLDKFMEGVRIYLKRFAYSNAKTNDLWAALHEASGVDVSKLMYSWTRETGYPLVEVVKEEIDKAKQELRLTVRQRRYLSSGDVKPEDDKTLWWIPLNIVTHNQAIPIRSILSTKEETITIPYPLAGHSEHAYYKLNADTNGFYRCKYPAAHLAKLGKVAKKNLSMSDRLGILMDAFALGVSGEVPTSEALELLSNMSDEDEYIVLSEMNSRLNSVLSTFYLEPASVRSKLKALGRMIFSPKVDSVGYEFKEGEEHMTSLKRTLIIAGAGKSGDEKVNAEIRRRFDLFVKGDESALHPNLRGTAFGLVLRNVSKEDAETVYNSVYGIYKNSSVMDEKLAALSALGLCPHEALVKRTLALALNAEEVRSQDIIYPLAGLRDNPNSAVTRPMLFEWLKTNWNALYERYHSSLSLLGRCLQTATEDSIGLEFVKQVENWVSGADLTENDREKRKEQTKGITRSIQQSTERIRSMTKWVEREREGVKKWLDAKFPSEV